MSEQKKPDNGKTGLMLAGLVLLFFIGFFVKRIWFT
jgi:hypothetical protein